MQAEVGRLKRRLDYWRARCEAAEEELAQLEEDYARKNQLLSYAIELVQKLRTSTTVQGVQ